MKISLGKLLTVFIDSFDFIFINFDYVFHSFFKKITGYFNDKRLKKYKNKIC